MRRSLSWQQKPQVFRPFSPCRAELRWSRATISNQTYYFVLNLTETPHDEIALPYAMDDWTDGTQGVRTIRLEPLGSCACSSRPQRIQMRDSSKLSAKEMSKMRTRGSVLAVAAISRVVAPWQSPQDRPGRSLRHFPRLRRPRSVGCQIWIICPSGTWRYHAADIAHGEDPNLDDSTWPVAESNVDYSKEGVWFRRWVQIPKTLDGYDITGADIWFHASVDAHLPLTQIVYVNGQQIAMADNIDPVEIAAHVKPGEKILVAVKALATVLPKRFNGVQITVHFAPDRPNPLDVRDEILSAAALLPSLEPDASGDRKVLEKATSQIDIKALDDSDQAKFDTSLRAAQATLEPLRPTMQKAVISMDGNAHIDAAWLWPWTESVDVVRRTFSTALQLMDEYPNYVFTQSAAAYNEWVAQKYPDINDEIAKRIKEGRWEVVGGMWVEPDLNLPDGESTARSILIGKRWYLQHYGVDVRVGWNPDSFGYTWQLPQIYKKSGVDYFVTQKMGWNETNQLPLKLFWWESPDGSKVLTYFPRGYANRDVGALRLSTDTVKARQQAPGITVFWTSMALAITVAARRVSF